MGISDLAQFENLVLVAGHAVYVGQDFLNPEQDRNWFLQEFQRGEPPFYIEHIRKGIDVASKDPSSLLVFSGGQTRHEAGPRSEARSYRDLADHFRWWSLTEVSGRATTEEFARDSFENLLFAICRFKECVGRYPQMIQVVSWAFKEERFGLHRKALGFPEFRFKFHGANQPENLTGALRGEEKAIAAFREDPYGAGEDLGRKRVARDPFRRQHSYAVSCPEVEGLLTHRGPDLYGGKLPWK
ncbi:MAG: hypothetical protein WBE72_03150 [Terracidiphilus sp.]